MARGNLLWLRSLGLLPLLYALRAVGVATDHVAFLALEIGGLWAVPGFLITTSGGLIIAQLSGGQSSLTLRLGRVPIGVRRAARLTGVRVTDGARCEGIAHVKKARVAVLDLTEPVRE